MKSFIALALITQSLTMAFAGTSDVVPKKFAHGSPYVRVTKVGNDKVRFEKCLEWFHRATSVMKPIFAIYSCHPKNHKHSSSI